MHTSVISDVKNNYLRYLLCFLLNLIITNNAFIMFFIIIICFVNLVSVILCLMYK